MTYPDIKIKIEGDDKLRVQFQRFSDSLGDLKTPLVKSAEFMRREAIENFAQRGEKMQSGGWPDLKDITKRIKLKEVGFVYPMMVRTGRLKRSFYIRGPEISRNSGWVEVYNPVSYAMYHQKGTSRMPKRILLKFQKRQKSGIRRIFQDWIREQIKKDFK